MMNIIKPLQVSFNHQVLEQNQKFRCIASATMGFHLTSGESLLEIDFLKDGFSAMGSHILPDPGMPKPQGEYLVSGKFFAPHGKNVNSGEVNVRVGEQSKSLYVFGEREWRRGVPSEPKTFSELELNYTQAYGGAGYDKNPAGIGYQAEQLPRIELAKNLLTANTRDDVFPASFAPLDHALPQRMQFQPKYDDDYLKNYFPGYPPGLDWRFFMAAPEDQWQEGYFKGGEPFEITHMNPDWPKIAGKIPDYFVRCFVEKNSDQVEDLRELSMNLDTVWFFPEMNLGWLIFRGGMDVRDDDATEIGNILLAYEKRGDDKRSLSHYRSALDRRLSSDDPLLNNFNTRDLIALGDEPAMVILQARALEDSEPSEFAKNLEAKSETMKQLIEDKLEVTQSELSERVAMMDAPDEANTLDFDTLLKDNTKDVVPDADVEAFNEKLEDLLPGITSGDPKQIKLEAFSFDKIEKIMDEVNALTEKKVAVAKKEIASAKSTMDTQIDSQLETMEGLDQEQINAVKQALESAENSEVTQDRPLPRLDVAEVCKSLEAFSKEVEANEDNLKKMQDIGMDEDQLKQYMDTLNAASQNDNAETQKKLEEAEQEFKALYRSSAHFQDEGTSPHKTSLDEVKKQFLRDIAAGISVANRDWACIDLSGEQLDGVDLSNAYLEQVNFSSASLRACNLSGAILARSNLSHGNFSGCHFDQANLGAVTAKSADFSQASFNDAKLSKGDFTESNFKNATLVNIENLEVTFNGCNFTQAKLPQVKFIEIDLRNAVFTYADLKSAAFLNSKVSFCDFSHAEMVLTTWAETSLESCRFDYANMTSNCFAAKEPEKIPLHKLSFVGASLDKSNFQFMQLPYADLTEASMHGVNCNYADLTGAKFIGADLKQGQFRNALLNDANFDSANIMEGSLSKASLVRTDLSNTNLFAVDFLRANVVDTKFHSSNLDVTLLKDWRP